MKEFHDARPCAERNKILRQEMNKSFLSSYVYVLDFIKSNFSIDTTLSYMRLNNLIKHEAISGYLFATYNNLVDAVEAEDTNRINKILDSLKDINENNKSLDVIQFSNKLPPKLLISLQHSMTRDFNKSFNGEYDIRAMTNSHYKRSLKAVRLAIKAIEEVDVLSKREINTLISNIILFDSNNVHAFSCFLSFGFIYLSNLKNHEHWTRYYEHIIHEAAHNHLFMLMTKDPLVIEGETKTLLYSPFRNEKRPVSGVYHAMFVLARTIRAFNLLLKSDKYADVREDIIPVYNKQDSTRLSFLERFEKTYEVLRDNAEMTTLGRKLLESCREIVHEK